MHEPFDCGIVDDDRVLPRYCGRHSREYLAYCPRCVMEADRAARTIRENADVRAGRAMLTDRGETGEYDTHCIDYADEPFISKRFDQATTYVVLTAMTVASVWIAVAIIGALIGNSR